MIDAIGFAVTIMPIALSPGASFTLAISNVPQYGMRGAYKVMIGTAIGIFFHSLLAGIGVSALLASSQQTLFVLNFFGIIFLLYLGFRLLWNGLKKPLRHEANIKEMVTVKDALFLNLLNAKALLVYVTVAPFFSDSQRLIELMMLGGIHIFIMSVWILLCGFLLLTVGKKFDIDKSSKYINIIGGIVLLILAVKAASKLYW